MTYNAADRKQVREKEKAERHLADVNRDVIVSLMSHINGRAWMFNHLGSCHVFHSTFASTDRESAFAEGERNVGLRILGDIMAYAPNEFITMMREANERASTAGPGGRVPDTDGRDSTPRDNPDSTTDTDDDTTPGGYNDTALANLVGNDEYAKDAGPARRA